MIIHQNYLVKKKVRILRSVGTQSEWVSIIMSYLLVKYLLVTLRWCLYKTCQYQRIIIQRMQLWSMHCDEFWRSNSYDVTVIFLQRMMNVPLENILLKTIQFFETIVSWVFAHLFQLLIFRSQWRSHRYLFFVEIFPKSLRWLSVHIIIFLVIFILVRDHDFFKSCCRITKRLFTQLCGRILYRSFFFPHFNVSVIVFDWINEYVLT